MRERREEVNRERGEREAKIEERRRIKGRKGREDKNEERDSTQYRQK